ncbi:nitrate- and nitrite sensing domain-containing protein [Streptomyces sp. NPDC057445]|uniref:nitrate- and nitrite sensing domain-containing protein n=1 Tax=Streptomyces sp. NPDC057445 TaxID=3346136 RepID=UPI00368E9A6F
MRTPRSTPGPDTPPPQRPTSARPAVPAARGRRAHAGPPAEEQPEPGTGQEAGTDRSAGRGPRERWRLRPRTVRAKIVSLLMVPVVSLLALWGFATVTTAQDVARLRQLQDIEHSVREPLAGAVTALQAERRAALRRLAAPGPDRAADLQQQAELTDAALAGLFLDDNHTVADAGDLPAPVAGRLREFVASAGELSVLRTSVLDGKAEWDRTYEAYTAVIASAFGVSGALTGIQDDARGSDARVLLEFGRAAEMLDREDALVTAARTAGDFSTERLRLFAGAVGTRRAFTESSVADLRAPGRSAWRELTAQSSYRALLAAEDRTLTAPAGRRAAQAVPSTTWDAAHSTVRTAMRDIERDARRSAVDRADPFGQGMLTVAGAAVLLGLVAVAASLVISVRIGRALVVELISLRNTALEIARHKLPHAMRRLRSGEELDVHAETPQGPAPQDEIAEVGEALSTVHRAALSAAVERAELSRGISGVFVNLARRSQVLVHRQLNLLDSMERRAEDPGELGDLFRLDHLTTRMRRHAESLIILSGAAPGRAWRMPVPLTNVVRAAVSEVEDYARVEVRPLPESAVVGAAVADLTHLLAELVENAAQFSPPHTRVRVSGEPVGNGYALEIEDRGLGMGKEALADANRRIDESEALDIFDGDRLGLFVVSRLSARHDIKVRLRTSPYGGTTAVVLIPTPLLQNASSSAGSPSRAVGHKGVTGPDAATPSAAQTAVHGMESALKDTAARAVEVQPDAAEPPPPGVIALRLRGRPHSAQQPESHEQQRPRPQSRSQARPDRSPSTTSSPSSPSFPASPSKPGDDAGGLPRRVRQASLVPQLREAPGPEAPDSADDTSHDTPDRTPEQARDRMAAYRAGWARGGGAAPGSTRSSSTPGTAHSSEGDDA